MHKPVKFYATIGILNMLKSTLDNIKMYTDMVENDRRDKEARDLLQESYATKKQLDEDLAELMDAINKNENK